MADHVKDETVSSPMFSSRTYESAWPRKDITLMLSPPGAVVAGTKGVLEVVILAEGFLRLTARSVNVQKPMDAKHNEHVYY